MVLSNIGGARDNSFAAITTASIRFRRLTGRGFLIPRKGAYSSFVRHVDTLSLEQTAIIHEVQIEPLALEIAGLETEHTLEISARR
jgi:hypothetical protein